MTTSNTLWLLFWIIIVNVPNVACCQTDFGARAGVNISTAKFDYNNPDPLIGLHVGLISEVRLVDNLFIRPELIYATKGWQFPDGNITLHYMNLPILLGIKPVPGLSIMTGAEVGWLLGVARNPPVSGFTSPYENFDYGIALGGAYNIKKKVALELRYTYGFDTLLKADVRDVNNVRTGEVIKDGANRVFQFSVVYFWRRKD